MLLSKFVEPYIHIVSRCNESTVRGTLQTTIHDLIRYFLLLLFFNVRECEQMERKWIFSSFSFNLVYEGLVYDVFFL